MRTIVLFVFLLSVHPAMAQQKELLAPTPPMGWNSWNWFGKHAVNEKSMKQCMDAMVDEGLLEAGYEYFVIDGGWRDSKLGANGELLSHPDKFPNGMKAMADYAHSKGLKFGLHTVPGTHDCGGDPVGGFGHEEVQVKQFVDWGLDFIKLDKCKNAEGWNEDLLKATYEKWHHLLENSGRDIVLNISAYQFRDWNPEVCQMSRTTLDIGAKVTGGARFDYEKKARNFLSVMAIAEENDRYSEYSAPGYWNDPDMLAVGDHGLTIEEQKAHFALWCIMSSPLMLGSDPRNMTPEEKNIILNKLAISINQDPTEQGRRIVWQPESKSGIWAKKLQDGKVAVLLLNRDNERQKDIELEFAVLGIMGKVKIKDIWSGEELGLFTKTFSKEIGPRSGSFLLLSLE